MHNTYAANWCFQSKCSNISAEGLHFSAFHYYRHCGCPACVCVCVCLFIYSFLPPRASTPRNIGAYVFTATRKTLYSYYNRDFLLKMLRSEATAGVICLPRMPLTAPELQNTDTCTAESTQRGHEITIIIFTILTKNASFRELLLRAHILNINMHKYITSAQEPKKDA